MITSPGKIFAFLTFPGVIMHEISHRLMRDFLRIPVYSINYFPTEETQASQAYHHKAMKLNHNLLICFAPLITNNLLCMLFTLPVNSMIVIARDPEGFKFSIVFLWWVGISMGVHAFPSYEDIYNTLLGEDKKNYGSFVGFLCFIANWFNYSRWIRFVYAVLVSYILPLLIFGSNFH